MRCIIAGTRTITDIHLVYDAIIASGFAYDITEVVCGGAEGADLIGDQYAFEIGLPVEYFLVTDNGVYDYRKLRNLRGARENVCIASDWKHNGNGAGPIRNGRMAQYADALVAVQCGNSTGTAGMIALAEKYGLRTYVEEVE